MPYSPRRRMVTLVVCLGLAVFAFAAKPGSSSLALQGKTANRCPSVKPPRTRKGPKAEVGPVVLSPAQTIILCRYWSLEAGPKAEKLAVVRVLRSRSLIRSIIEEMNQLEPGLKGEHTCPESSGALALGLLDYPQRTIKLTFGLSGCHEVAIGVHGGARIMSPAFLHRIARLSTPS
jgi:hypothetical protein